VQDGVSAHPLLGERFCLRLVILTAKCRDGKLCCATSGTQASGKEKEETQAGLDRVTYTQPHRFSSLFPVARKGGMGRVDWVVCDYGRVLAPIEWDYEG